MLSRGCVCYRVVLEDALLKKAKSATSEHNNGAVSVFCIIMEIHLFFFSGNNIVFLFLH